MNIDRHNRDYRVNELAPCGVYCGACPSFNKTCKGCSSEDNQKRKSKFSCKIRICCYENKKFNYCIHCSEFPCKLINNKLLNTYTGDIRFTYRHEIPKIFPELLSLGLLKYIEFQKNRWKCKSCGEKIMFYHNKCSGCGKKISIE